MTAQKQDNMIVVAVVVALFAMVTAVAAVGFGMRAIDEKGDPTPTSAVATKAPVATLSELKIEPGSITAPVDGTVKVENTGATQHNLAVEGTDKKTEMLSAGDAAILDLGGLAAGTYKVFCEIPGHAAAGMTAELKIGGRDPKAAVTPTTSPAHEHEHEHSTMSTAGMDETMAKATKAFPAKTEGTGAQELAPTVLPDGTKQFDLTAKVVQWEVEPGKKVRAFTYNGTVPGPTLRVEDGDKVRIVLQNQLPESTAIHFHGLHTPNAMDGVPDITQDPVKPGASFTYEFVAKGPAVGMYHSHHNAAKQLPDGLAGAFLVGHEPVPKGVHVSQEQPMILNDAGTIGLSLNGKSFPATAPVVVNRGESVLVHYMNEGVMAHPMHLHGTDQLVVAKDGFPLAQPYLADTINVAPGERYTVLVTGTEPGTWAWHCHILPHAEREDGMFGMVTALVVK